MRTNRLLGGSVRDFINNNKRLILYLTFLLVGTFFGIFIYISSKSYLQQELSKMVVIRALTGGLQEVLSTLLSSCLSVLVLLLILFMFGLSVYAAPVTFFVPVFFGLGLGMTEAFYYAMGTHGILTTLVLVIPRNLIAATALIMACSESLRFSLLLSNQILPTGERKELWNDFKLYCTRFLLFLGISLASGAVDICCRLLFGFLI